MKRAAIITASDSGYRGEREDLSGPAIKEILEREGYEVISMDILPDDQVMLAGKMQEIADSEKGKFYVSLACNVNWWLYWCCDYHADFVQYAEWSYSGGI